MGIELTGPYDVDLAALRGVLPDEAVTIFRHLIVAEAVECGIPVSAVDVPSAINVADGGVDAEVKLAPGSAPVGGLIFDKPARYQIKTGIFTAAKDAEIKALLLAPAHLKRRKLRKEHLNPRVRACLEKGHTFVAVLFGAEAVATTDRYAETQIIAILKKIDASFANADVRILRSNQVATAIKRLSPGLALYINRLAHRDDEPLHDINFLRLSCQLEIGSYVASPQLKQDAASIKAFATNPVGFKHLRVLGDSGSGKTHLVYEALKDTPHVLYCPDAEQLDTSSSFLQLLQLSSSATIVLVADECDMDTAMVIQGRLKNRAGHCLLISIFNRVEDNSALGDGVPVITVPRLEKPLMAQIFEGYGIDKQTADWLAGLCEGSPEAAHRIGRYSKENPGVDLAQHFKKLDDIWTAIVCNPHQPSSKDGILRLAVARTIALFRRLAWDGTDGKHGKQVVLDVVTKLDSSISPAYVVSAVDDFRKQRFVQGFKTLYISPVLLHIALWRDWWDMYEHIVPAEQVRKQLTGRMLGWFDDMLIYADQSRAASEVCQRLLGPGGPFATLGGFSAPGNASLFFALAQSNPKAALRRLKAALDKAPIDERKQFGPGRREVVHGLERMAIPASGFFDATECLVLLAEAENETWSNNASGVLVSMFSLGYGKVAASEVAPSEKIPLLRELLQSPNRVRRGLAVRALHESLSPFISRMDVGEREGLRLLPRRWMPKTNEDWWNEIRAYVELAFDASNFLPETERRAAASAIITHSRNLVSIPSLAARLIEILSIYSRDSALRDAVIENVVQILHFDAKGLKPETRGALDSLNEELTQRTLGARIRRYAGLQLVEDHFPGGGDDHVEIPEAWVNVAEDAIKRPQELIEELSWLVTDAAKNGHAFGALLGERDRALGLWTPIVRAWIAAGASRSDFFLGGYLSGLHSQDAGLWELVIGEIFETPGLEQSLPSLVWRSGMSDTVAYALHRLMKAGAIPARSFGPMVYGNVVAKLPRIVVVDAIRQLLRSKDAADAATALDMLASRIRTKQDSFESLSNLVYSTLSHPLFLRGGNNAVRNTMVEYHWTQLALKLADADTAAAWKLADNFLAAFGSRNSIAESHFSNAIEFLDKLIVIDPERMWALLAARIEPPIDSRGFHLMSWLRGDRIRPRDNRASSGFGLLPVPVVINWISKSPALRPLLIAQFCPPVVSRLGEPPSLARAVLEGWGSDAKVRRALHGNYFSGTFWGPASAHYAAKRAEIESLLPGEKNIHVRKWLEEEIEDLTAMIEREQDREEAEDF